MATRRPHSAMSDSALDVLRRTAHAAATQVFPPLKDVADVTLRIVDLVKGARRNKVEWEELGSHIEDLIASVVQSLNQVEISQVHKAKVEMLRSTLNEILESVDAKLREGRRMHVVRSETDMIADMKTRINEAANVFQLGVLTSTMVDVERLSQAMASSQGTLSNVAQGTVTLTAKTDSIERNTAKLGHNDTLNKLRRVAGASWDVSRVCLPNTRVYLTDEVARWVHGQGRPNWEQQAVGEKRLAGAKIMLLTGVAGAGKTTVAHSVAQRYAAEGRLGSSFFFDRETEGRNSPDALVTTIAADLSRLSESLGGRIAAAIEDDPSLPLAPLSRQFEELLVKPCTECLIPGPVVIVVDALDEAWDEDLLEILQRRVPQLPDAFRVFLTSRMRPGLGGLLQKAHVKSLELNIDARSNMEDIAVYVPNALRKVAEKHELGSSWPGKQLETGFTTKANGLFLWVTTVCKFLYNRNDPTRELTLLVSADYPLARSAEGQMNELYARILNGFDWTDDSFVTSYRRIMGTAIAAKTPLTIAAMEDLYQERPLALEFTLQQLSPLLTGMRKEDRGTQPVRVLHQSLRDFLVVQATSPPAPTGYKIVEREWSQELALLCLELLNRELNVDTPGTGYLAKDKESVPGIPSNYSIPEALRYACVFWQHHIYDVESLDKVGHPLERFMDQKLIQWMEVSAVCGRYGGINDVQQWMQVIGSNSSTLPSQPYNQVHASALLSLSSRLRYEDRREEALTSVEEAVKVYERLNVDPPAAFTPDLAMSLNNLSVRLSALGRREEALATIEEATQLRRQLAADRPAAFTPGLAKSLDNLSSCLSNLGRREDALATIEEATQLRRQLAADRPAAFTPYLATSIHQLSLRLSDLGRREEALATIEEATQLYRQIAADRPAAFTPHLATSLNSLSNRLSALGRREEALATIEEATQLRRQLAADRPAAFTPYLATSIHQLSLRLSDLGRREEALATVEEATQLRRQLAADRPAAFTPDLATSLDNLSSCLSDLGRREEALATIEEATQLRRQLAADRPAAFTPGLAGSLNNFSSCLSDLGRREDALATIEEATQLYRQLAADRPAAFTPDLATSLDNLSSCLSDLGRREEALATSEEATQLRRQLAADRPAAFAPDLAMSLNNISLCLYSLGRLQDALAAIEESVVLQRQLAASRPQVFGSKLKNSLRSLSRVLTSLGRDTEAAEAAAEAADLLS